MRVTILVVSTSHLPASIATGDDPEMNDIASMSGEHAWLVYVGACERFPGKHPELCAVLDYARGQGCTYVMFDSAGVTDKRFPTFDW